MGLSAGMAAENNADEVYLRFIKTTSGVIKLTEKQVGRDCDFPDNMGIIIETPGFIPYYSGYKTLNFLQDCEERLEKQR